MVRKLRLHETHSSDFQSAENLPQKPCVNFVFMKKYNKASKTTRIKKSKGIKQKKETQHFWKTTSSNIPKRKHHTSKKKNYKKRK